jgi:hypothetical protein
MTDSKPSVNKGYIIGVSALTFLLPAISAAIEYYTDPGSFSLLHGGTFLTALLGKWFIFYAVGVRLLLAGIRQIKNPGFTAKEIFHIESDAVLPIVRELGFANLCAGLVGIIALFVPQWRIVSAFSSGLYYGIAGLYHFIKKPAGINEQFALITDIIIFLLLVIYVVVLF